MAGPIVTIPAATAPEREGLELTITTASDSRGERWLLECRGGRAAFELGPAEATFLATYGPLVVRPVAGAAGRGFCDAVARWLGLAFSTDGATEPREDGATLTGTWVRLGRGSDAFGIEWETYKLFLRLGTLYAEVFLRRAVAGGRAQLVEKWSRYRAPLAAILERVMSDAPPRACGASAERSTGPQGELLYSIGRALEIAIPDGWRLAQAPEGHWRLSDPDDEALIELSCRRLPPLPQGTPGVEARLRSLLDASEHREDAATITTFARDETEFAWCEYRYEANDTKAMDAPKRPARGRYLLGANAWVQVAMTAAWWESDVPWAEQAWNDVVASTQLAARVEPEAPNDPQS